ncbi:MAG: succinate dehydrogenase, hydrophobic membrane anchor protein [Rickettsiales bacterium]|nr:succinate dehydrogenase, hydrophobic membrane anchor protein [Rickettsiales bacterium]
MSNLRSDIKKARGLGSAKSGTSHFIAERATALALIPLGLWFVVSLICLAMGHDSTALNIWLKSPFNAAFLALFIIFGFWHSKLGIQVVIEDYVHKAFSRNSLLILSKALHILFGLICLMAVIQLHFFNEVPV